MTTAKDSPLGYLALTLHAHLPYVVHHGTWPHGIEWLHEAAAETYLPFLRVLRNLERDSVPANFNVSLSPVLLEQLSHPIFIADFPRYLTRKIVAAREDEAFFVQSGDLHLTEIARFWGQFFSMALEDFQALNGNIIHGFRHFQETGAIEILTSAATHGYLPLLGTDESVRAQIRTGVATHKRHIGSAPRGIWIPECGYRPAGYWKYPAPEDEAAGLPDGFERIGIEQALAECELEYFFVDTHLVEESKRILPPYGPPSSRLPRDPQMQRTTRRPRRSLYQPYYVDGSYDKRYALTIFPRDPSTGTQVWSGENGYPGDPHYLDFHKKRFPGGHRYWKVTGPRVDIGDKQVYWPHEAELRIKEHASHFVRLVHESLESGFSEKIPPVLCAPFDAELFGHWWFEGPMWLEAVCRTLYGNSTGVATIRCSQYLNHYPRASYISMPEGSWGAEGNHQVWLNPDTSWTYSHLYPAEIWTREMCTEGTWRDSELGARIARQVCRELLLMESSDWQFLITTGAARDYGEMRFVTHNDQFLELRAMWQELQEHTSLDEQKLARLREIEQRDSIFSEIDPSIWAQGASQSHKADPTLSERAKLAATGVAKRA